MKIICIGRNYTNHIEELHNERPTEPVVFMKPDLNFLTTLASYIKDGEYENKEKSSNIRQFITSIFSAKNQ